MFSAKLDLSNAKIKVTFSLKVHEKINFYYLPPFLVADLFSIPFLGLVTKLRCPYAIPNF